VKLYSFIARTLRAVASEMDRSKLLELVEELEDARVEKSREKPAASPQRVPSFRISYLRVNQGDFGSDSLPH
jgi:hypothetical protein